MTLLKLIRTGLLMAICFILASCGGGSGSSGGSSGAASTLPAFTLGGKVSGLAVGANVVFQVVVSNSGNTNDTTQTITITGNGAFVSPAAVVSEGGSFIILVATQPTGQICTVSNGSGTNIIANVTNISVVCSATSYTVSVSASGLLPGQQVILQNNGDYRTNKVLTINANSTPFTFADPVASGGGYSVTISTEPLVSTCSIVNAAGSNVSADVTSITVTCGPATADSWLYSFGATGSGDAIQPEVGLVQGLDGSLYGATGVGGVQQAGAIYAITLAGIEHVAYSFKGSPTDGQCPQAPLIQATDGNFYGTTCLGGATDSGTIYMLTPSGTETVLHSFNTTVDGDSPLGALVQADGYLYGTTSHGGTYNSGTAFKIGLGGIGFTTLYAFGVTGGDAMAPHATMIQGVDNNLYGTTLLGGAYGYGTVFQLSILNKTVTVIHSFGQHGDGNMAAPGAHEQAAALVQYTDGTLYGTTPTGGANGGGTVFQIGTSTPYSVLYSFGSVPSDGLNPQAALLLANDGYFYGTTVKGGLSGGGTVFRIAPGGSENVMYSFGVGDGQYPVGALIQAKDGHLYGTTSYGGANENGIVFKF